MEKDEETNKFDKNNKSEPKDKISFGEILIVVIVAVYWVVVLFEGLIRCIH